MEIEDRIFELTGEVFDGVRVMDIVADEYGLDCETVAELYLKVRRERGSPQRVRTREAIARLGRVRLI